jgi:hypothetical protein
VPHARRGRRAAQGLRPACLTLRLFKSSVAGTAPAYQSAGTTGGHRSNEHEKARSEWGNPGKNHNTIDKWND